jgi:hypothetical protein
MKVMINSLFLLLAGIVFENQPKRLNHPAGSIHSQNRLGRLTCCLELAHFQDL